MCAAFRRVDIIDKGINAFVISVVMLHCHFDRNIVLHSFEIKDIAVKRRVAPIDIGDKFFDAAFEMEDFFFFFLRTGIRQRDPKPLCQECHLTQPCLQRFIVVYRLFKDLPVRKEGDDRSGLFERAVTQHLQGMVCLASGIFLMMDLSFPVDRYFQFFRKRIHDGCADTVQTAGYFISAAAEFSAGMQFGKYQFHGGYAFFGADARRDPASVIFHGDGIIRIDRHMNFRTVSSQGFVHGIVHDLIDQMVESSLGNASDIHARTLPYCLQAFQDLDTVRVIFLCYFGML